MSAAERRERPLVPADAWRRQVSRDGDRRTLRRHRLSEADRPGGRSARLFRSAASDRQELRGLLGHRLGAGAADGATPVSRGGAAGPPVPGRRGAHDRDPRPHLARSAFDQRRHGGDPTENKGDGIFLSHDERYEVTREFLDVYRALLSGETVNYSGKHIRIEDGRLLFEPVQKPFRRSISAARRTPESMLRPQQVDKYLTWGEPPAQVEEKIETVTRAAARKGRRLTYGIRLHVIVRETSEEAWAAADRLISHLDDATIASAQDVFKRMDFVGSAPHGGSSWRAARQAGSEPEPLGGRRSGTRRSGHGAGRRSGDGCDAYAGIHGARDRYIHPLRLSASGRGLSVRRTCLAVAAARAWPVAGAQVDANMGPFGETIANVIRPTEKRVAQS